MRKEALISVVVDSHWRVVLQRYYEYMLTVREKRVSRGRRAQPNHQTMTIFLRSGKEFFDFLAERGIHSETEIPQDLLDEFIATQENFGGCGISGLVNWLNAQGRVFRKLRLTRAARRAPGNHLLLGDSKVASLLNSFLAPTDGDEGLRLMAILLLLYGQRPRFAIKFRLTDVLEAKDGKYQMRLGRVEVILDRRVSDLLGRYLNMRRERSILEPTGENEWLFPGQTAGTHLGKDALSDWLWNKHGVREQQLWRTSLERAFRYGNLTPKAVQLVTGAGRTTIMEAWWSTNPRAREERNFGGLAVSNEE